MKTNKKEIEISKNIKFWATSKLVPYEKNARTHSDEQVSQIAASILEFGFTNPVLVDSKCGVIAGHGRLMAAKQLGLKEVPVIVLDHLNEKQKRAYILADNKLALNAGWDEAVLAEELAALIDSGYETDVIGFSKQELAEFLPEEAAEENERADEIPEVAQNELGVKLGDIYQLGEHRLMCGDSTDLVTVEKLMNGEKADMVFTDPPYGIAYDNAKRWEGTKKQSQGAKINAGPMIMGDDTDFDPSFILRFFEYCKEIFVWGMQYYPDKLKRGGAIVWNRKTKEQEECPFADFELCWSKAPRNAMAWIIWGGYISKEKGEVRLHTTQKPIALAEWFLSRWGKDKSIIVDLFLGSGSTLIACEKTNRKCFGMELDPHYCSVIIKRWEIFTGKKAKKIFPVKTILKKKKIKDG